MPEEQPPELTAKIVAAYVRRNEVPPDQLAPLIATVHHALAGLGKPASGAVERTPAVPIRRSVQRDYVVCLECGWRGKMLRRHIGTHGLSVDAYRARWNLLHDHAMVAPAYSERRSTMAKQIGLGRGGRKASVGASAPAASKSRTPRRRPRRPRPPRS
jgi:predicted transcriptional regulator